MSNIADGNGTARIIVIGRRTEPELLGIAPRLSSIVAVATTIP